MRQRTAVWNVESYSEKKNDLDIISFGPELTGVHTYNERVHIESTKRMWDYLKELLKICK